MITQGKFFFPGNKLNLVSAFFVFFIFAQFISFAQPANDNCNNASVINISNGGFAIGTFISTQFDISAATVQAGETFAPAILVAGQNQKSIWYKFSLPTTRSVRVTLSQPGSLITAGDAGFAVYKTNNCLPAGTAINNKLTPIGLFGNTFHPCVEDGDYIVQVSAKTAANGPVFITVETGLPTAAYDQQTQAYNFGVLPRGISTHPAYTVGCQSLEDAGEICNTLGNYQNYTKSTWHVFTTPAYLDYLNIVMGGWPTAAFKFGFKVYQGDVRSTPYSSLPVAWGCDSLVTDGFSYANKVLGCGVLNPNTTYSLQLLYDKNYNSQITLDLVLGGMAPSKAPEPILSAITPTTNNLGVLPSSPTGIVTTATDNLACNARHSIHPCEPSLPSTGVMYNGESYKLSSFFLFTLSSTSTIQFTTTPNHVFCNSPLLLRLYNQSTSNNCATLDTANIINTFIASKSIPCLPPGNYTLQVMGSETGTSSYCPKGSLGSSFTLSLTAKTINASNKFNLSSSGAFDTLNRVSGIMQPLVPGVTYNSKIDTFGCGNTVLPNDKCNPSYTKAIYREFNIADSGIISLWSPNAYHSEFKILKGDANALAISQSVFNYPATISGLTNQTLCMPGYSFPICDGQKACILPGTYTMVNYGNQNSIGVTNQMQARFDIVNTTHYNLATAEDMGDILSIIPPAGGSVTSNPDYFSCKDNAIVIDGYQPCKEGYGIITSTKAIYRQFYLSSPASVSISSQAIICGYVPLTLFRGKATDGIAALTVMPSPWRCFDTKTSSDCDQLPAGWYTIVSYGWGASYENPTRDVNSLNGGYIHYGGSLGYGNRIQITVNVPPCPKPKYNRPYKAAIDTITGQPYLIQWAPIVGHTTAYPKTDTTYTLYTENFNCSNDTPFATHPVISCYSGATKVAYWVFRITQESFVSINTENYWNGAPYAHSAKVYAGNARTDSTLFGTAQPIQPCLMSLGHLQLCKLQPGDYTLVVFATSDAVCKTITPSIYIDQVGYSRFDHAKNAYDFGQIRPDSTWYNGKPNDINPLNPGRAASNDFFYCTTGAQPTDPLLGCASVVLPNIYNSGNNNPLFTSNYITNGYLYPLAPARNLWYTFTVDKGGQVKVRVNNKTIGKGWQYNFIVVKSNVDGTLPFNTVVASGGVDSTIAQGLEVIASNDIGYCDGVTEVSFFRETCTPIPERYYIIVANRVPSNRHNHDAHHPEWMYPNHQVEVSVLFDTVNAILPKFDHYYQANNIGTNLGPGTYTGATDNISCATVDAADPRPVPCVNRNIWYKFTTTVSGSLVPRAFQDGIFRWSNVVQLYKEIIPGDSTTSGLQYIDLAIGNGVACITPGTYYLLITACDPLTDPMVYPQIQIYELAGDYCSRPVIATLNGAGNSVTSANIGCHTIGTDYGEFNPTLTCPAGAVTSQYKTSWFKINISGTDTLDVTTFLSNNTNTASSQIKYRLMNGDCNAMQERSCVQDAQTQDTYKCLAPGDYWVQVFTPLLVGSNQVIGSINLHLSAVKHVDTCAPVNACLSNANFQKQFDCNTSTAVRFINYSTFGSSISYLWNFGYGGQTSTAVSPSFTYPALTVAQTYTITLTVTNNTCSGVSTFSDTITIPPRPGVNLGADTSLCNGGSVLLNATSHPGSTYLWNNGSTNSTLIAATPGQNNYWVAITYNGCVARDTVRVNINPIVARSQNLFICGGNAAILNSLRGLGESHFWNTGATTSSINVFSPGIYWNDINLRGCITRDSFTVSASPSTLGTDRAVCFGSQPVVLNATTSGATGYTWQNGSTIATFTAPSAGLYWVDISFGNCTLRDTIILTNILPQTNGINAAICQGNTYTLPSGMVVNTAGVYSDTTRTNGGCDSMINHINLTLKLVAKTTSNVAICSVQSYTLPWGLVVNTSGIYRDTIRYISSACDSLQRTVNLVVQSPNSLIINAGICAGQSYTLPGGTIVNLPGVYKDTVKYSNTNCDSLYRTVNLSVAVPQSISLNPIICSGQNYLLPWGASVNVAGIYKDTLRFAGGCDSLYRTVNLIVQTSQFTNLNQQICIGQNYTLPWGAVVNTSGIYRDTLRYTSSNCDSLIRTVNLTVQTPSSTTSNVGICAGQQYTLPWGLIVNTAGVYKDSLRYTSTNCDSLIRTYNISVNSSTSSFANVTICSGQSYTLPWGVVVSAAGVYSDTLRYVNTNCDSIRRTINIAVRPTIVLVTNPVVCSGQSYTLPWGVVVNASGVYRDTIRYASSTCDSLIRVVNLVLTQGQIINSTARICSGNSYLLPNGITVNTAGIFRDTIKTIFGCDSIVRIVNLSVNPLPVLNVSKSNDINCVIGVSKLSATGGVKYLWNPGNSLSDSNISNPLAFPLFTTTYRVKAMGANSCIKEDSVVVTVTNNNLDNGFLLPDAFTPNSDGKNDCFGVRSWGMVSNLKFEIFSRWGKRIFFTNDPSKCWDGSYNGDKQSTGVFVYSITADTHCGKVYRKGTVTLIR